jgi:pyridoxal phosphate enzyme (YggS family)
MNSPRQSSAALPRENLHLSALPPHVEPEHARRIAGAFDRVRDRIATAAARSGRPAQCVTLLAVTKAFGPETIAAAVAAGQRCFGENYVQEATAKMAVLAQPGRIDPAAAKDIVWHFIGPIQSNKTRAIAAQFAWVQSIDRASIAQRLARQRDEQIACPAGPLDVLLEVNVSGESTKSGVSPDALRELSEAVCALAPLRLRGLMAIPQPGLAPAAQRAAFARLRALFDATRAGLLLAHGAVQFDTLSMGMSDDFEAAILEGSTMVRIGSALFGARK